MGLRSGATTGAQAFGSAPSDPTFFQRSRCGRHPLCLFTQPQLGGMEPLGSRELPDCRFREISAPQAPLWPWLFPGNNSLHAGKIPSPRVQVSKELLGPLLSLEWAPRGRCSCLACFSCHRVLLLTPELPRIVSPQPVPGNREGREIRLCSLWGSDWERQAAGPAPPH